MTQGKAIVRWFAAGALAVVVAGGLAGCGGGTISISTTDGRATVRSGHRGLTFYASSPGGSASLAVGTAVSVPAGFPSVVPLPSGVKLVEASSDHSSSGPAYTLIYDAASASEANAELAAYDTQLRGAGYAEQGSTSYSGTQNQVWRSSNWG